LHWSRTVAAGTLLLFAAACGNGLAPDPTPATTATPSAPPTVVAVAPLAEWQRRGATEAPPPAVLQVSLRDVQVVNQTGGAVGDADARAWALGWLRTYELLLWAVSRGQDQFLVNSSLASAPLAVFRPNLNDILQSRQARSRAEYSHEVFRRLVLRAVPSSLTQVFKDQLFVWKPYALFLDAVGPITTSWVDAQGVRTVKSSVPAGAAAYELIGGEFKRDPVLGEVWVMASDWNCTASSTRSGLAPLCNP
jgi:hypothetical protein